MDLTQLWQFVSTLKAQQLAGIALLAFAAYHYRGYLFAQFARLKITPPATTPPTDTSDPDAKADADTVAAIESFNHVKAHFKKTGCTKGLEALKSVWPHFLKDHVEG